MAFRAAILLVLASVAAFALLACGGTPSPEEPTFTPTPTPPPTLAPPPALLGLEDFYEKYLDADGIHVVASAGVSDEALFRVAATIDEMLADRPDLREAVVAAGARVVVLAPDQLLTDIPEFRDWARQHPDWTTFDGRAMSTVRGLGPTLQVPVTVIAEELVLCYPDQPYRGDVLVHEVAHMVLDLAVGGPSGTGGFWQQVNLRLTQALQQGLWRYTYAASNADEYWAVAVEAWFDVGGSGNGVDTREELEAYDPAIARLVREVFGDAKLSSSCHLDAYPHTEVRPHVVEGVVLGAQDEPLPGVVFWVYSGEEFLEGHRTFEDGTFILLAGDNELHIAFCTSRNGQTVFAGWYGGPTGLTVHRSLATPIVATGEPDHEVVLRLSPGHGITGC